MPPPPRSGLTGAAGGAARNDHNRLEERLRASEARQALVVEQTGKAE